MAEGIKIANESCRTKTLLETLRLSSNLIGIAFAICAGEVSWDRSGKLKTLRDNLQTEIFNLLHVGQIKKSISKAILNN